MRARSRSAQRWERLVTAAGARRAPAPRSRLRRVARDSLIKFQATSGASDKGQLGPPRPQPIPQAASAGCWRALRASGASRSLSFCPPRRSRGRGAAPGRVAEAVGVGGAVVFYIRVDEMMARGE